MDNRRNFMGGLIVLPLWSVFHSKKNRLQRKIISKIQHNIDGSYTQKSYSIFSARKHLPNVGTRDLSMGCIFYYNNDYQNPIFTMINVASDNTHVLLSLPNQIDIEMRGSLTHIELCEIGEFFRNGTRTNTEKLL